MGRGVLSVQSIVPAGLAPSLAAASAAGDGDSFPNDGRTLLWIKNSGAGVTVTVATYASVGGYAVADQTCAVANTDTNGKFLGPFDPAVFNRPDGTVYVDYGAASTNITLGAFKM